MVKINISHNISNSKKKSVLYTDYKKNSKIIFLKTTSHILKEFFYIVYKSQ